MNLVGSFVFSMKNLKKYLKYYFLEDYLFKEISKNFLVRNLTAEEFFSIVIWKSNRAKTKVKKGLIKRGLSVDRVSASLKELKSPKEKLSFLDDIPGIGIPLASAILAVCYPNDFTIVDYRSCASLNKLGDGVKGNPTSSKKAYFAYLDKCKFLAKKFNLSLRDFDRILWGMDFYEGGNGLRELAVDFPIATL
jgi:thermostable 8-oxoguanine DNA glycosylase